ncbi:MAG: choice-of-anchor D domain-containing protein [Lewinellaceae bacterium]|nr:choice-of-anchor D domain-containing protein [Lewinellaceae bacterium]
MTDANGCSAQVTGTVTVNATPTCNITSGPTSVCPNSTGHMYTATGGGTYQWSITGNGTIVPPDNTSSVTVDAGATGTYTVTVEVTDNGCTSTCSQTVTVEDITPPSITCPANINVNNDAGLCSAVVNYVAPVGLDNCPGQTTMQTAGLASGATFPVGITTNTFTVTAANSQTTSCSFTVTVTDNEPPTISCSSVTPVNNTPGQCDAPVTVPTPGLSGFCTRNHALDFDGVDDYVSASHDPVLNLTGDASFEAWVYLKGPNDYNSSHSIFDKTEISDLANYRYFLAPNNRMGFWNGTTNVFSTTAVPTGQWVHLAWVLESGTMTFYENGVSIGTGSTALGAVNNGPLTIGRDNNQVFADQRNINIKLDEVRLWNIPRSQAEIQAAKDLEINSSYPGLIAFYNFNEAIACCDNSGLTTLPDGMGANNGTLSNFPLAAGCASNWVPGAPALGDPLTLTNDVTSDCSSASGTYPVGMTTVTWTATGANGQTATCEQTVTVTDDELPSITCPANLTVNTPSNSCQATGVALGSPAVSDNCSTSVSNDATEPYALGNTTVTWMVSDGSNSTTCAQVVTVEPYVAPPGSYFDLGTCQSTPCPPGTYCPGGTTAGIPCPAGTAQSLPGQETCAACPAGYFSSSVGATECTACAAGEYSDVPGSTSCTACPYGTGSMAAATSCTPLDPQEISVFGNSNQIANRAATVSVSDDTDFGAVSIGNMVTHTFTIYNIVNAVPLKLSGNPSVEIADRDASDFSVTAQPSTPVASGGSTTFTVKFQPTATGLRSAIIMIASDDFPEKSFVFTVQGTGQ